MMVASSIEDLKMPKKHSLLAEEFGPDLVDTAINMDDMDERTMLTRDLNRHDRTAFHDLKMETVSTRHGEMQVAIQGREHSKCTALLTLHDIGQNHVSAFQSFFCFHQFRSIADNFIVYHLNFPGQEENAAPLPEDYIYPTMDEIAEAVEEVIKHYNIRNTICFGIGAGANVFTRVALLDPKHVECLIAVNGVIGATSWGDWSYQKLSSHYLKTKGMTQFCVDYLLYHYFGKTEENPDLVAMITENLHQIRHPRNLALFIESHAKRTPIKIVRPVVGKPSLQSLKCGALIITGDRSPAVDDTVFMNSKLDPEKTSWMKIADASSLVLEEQPTHVANAVVLFLQGYGHVLKMRPPALSFTAMDEEIQGPLAVC